MNHRDGSFVVVALGGVGGEGGLIQLVYQRVHV
jgi:hypothetical protein